jgi:ABC-type lipoprotein export system ATPase subunit
MSSQETTIQTNAIFRTEQLCRRFLSGHEDDQGVLDGINLVVTRQSLTMLKGRSGSGQNDFDQLRLGARFDHPDIGQNLFRRPGR